MYYFLLTKLKHYSVTCGRVSREKGVQGDGFRVSPWGGLRPLIMKESFV